MNPGMPGENIAQHVKEMWMGSDVPSRCTKNSSMLGIPFYQTTWGPVSHPMNTGGLCGKQPALFILKPILCLIWKSEQKSC